jgi:hypothetical protein
MTSQIERRPSHTASADSVRERRGRHGSIRQARARRVYDGVVASYLREIAAAPAERSGRA